MANVSSASNDRPGLAVLANTLPPYRVHLHRLIVEGIPEVQLHTLVTHGDADFTYQLELPAEINVHHFGSPGDSPFIRPLFSPRRIRSELKKARRIVSYLKDQRVEAIICSIPIYWSYLAVLRHCHRAGISVFVRSDANIRDERFMGPVKRSAKRSFYRWWMPQVTGVMPMGQYGADFFRQYGARDERMYFVPYFPDFDFFRQRDDRAVEQLRQRFSWHRDRRRLMYSGRLAPVKRVDLLVDAFVQIAGERPEWDLVVVGSGPLESQLREKIPAALRDRVIWTGFLEPEQLRHAYHACDALVLPSRKEPWALVIQEAMAAGLAVVSSDIVGAAREMVADQVNGRIFRADDLDHLRECLLDVTQPDRIDQYKQNSGSQLESWLAAADPVGEIRRALLDAGRLPN